jgi:hypothetical protein
MFSAQDSVTNSETAPVSPTVPKWPFIFGDLVLLAAALGLWATQAPLSSLQTLLTLCALGLGAVLFVLPFIMEFTTAAQLRSLELEQARAEDFQRLSALDAETRKQARVAIEAQEHAARAAAALENLARKLEARLAPLEAVQKGLETAVAQLPETADRLASQQKDSLDHQQTQADKLQAAAAAVTAALKRLDALADQPPPSPDPIAVSTLESIHERLEIISHLLAQFRLPEPDIGPSSAKESKLEEGGSMLAKALSTVQPAGDSPAVSRIIESRPRRGRKPKPAPEAESAPPAPTPPPSEAADALSAGGDTPAETTSATAVVETPAPAESVPETASAPVDTDDTAKVKAAALLADESEVEAPAQTELLEPAAAPRRKRGSKSETAAATLVARVLIGIGNKPYVRGEGPGLSPDKGVPMEFVEIGQWRWVAPASATDAITLHILKNDEVPADGGPITLQPGQTLEVNPEFPG